MYKLVLLVAAAVVFSTAPRGDYHIEIPIAGLTADQQAEVELALQELVPKVGLVSKVVCDAGVLSFRTGRKSAESLLFLSDIEKALAKLKLDVDPETWTLRPQTLGLAISAEKGANLERILVVLGSARGTLLHGTRLLLVVELEEETDYAVLRAALEEEGVQIDDLVWGHWFYGWEIKEKRGISHEFGARVRM